MARDIDLGVFSVGDTDRFEFNLKRKTEAGLVTWALSGGAVVTFTFNRPADRGGESFDRAATVVDGPNGVVRYDSLDTDLDVDGNWTLRIHVEDGSVKKTYPYEIGFEVRP